jgi:alkylation response protein AidB-like acyl-CoA dehydrogenase
VRPLVQMDGEAHYNEVFINDVTIPDEWRIGAIGSGWTVAMTTLAHERAAMGSRAGASGRVPGTVPAWLRQLSRSGALADPVLRDRAISVYILEQTAWLTGVRASGNGQRLNPAVSGGKLRRAQVHKAISELLKDGVGAAGLLTEHRAHKQFLGAPAMSLMGGTDEIQRNVIAERILGLPKEPRLDRDVPWTESRRGVL